MTLFFFSAHLYTLRALVRGSHASRSSFGGRRIPQNYLVWEILKIDSRPYKLSPSSHDYKSRPQTLLSAASSCWLRWLQFGAAYPAALLAYPIPLLAYPAPLIAYPTPVFHVPYSSTKIHQAFSVPYTQPAYPTALLAYPTPLLAYPIPLIAYPTPLLAYPIAVLNLIRLM